MDWDEVTAGVHSKTNEYIAACPRTRDVRPVLDSRSLSSLEFPQSPIWGNDGECSGKATGRVRVRLSSLLTRDSSRPLLKSHKIQRHFHHARWTQINGLEARRDEPDLFQRTFKFHTTLNGRSMGFGRTLNGSLTHSQRTSKSDVSKDPGDTQKTLNGLSTDFQRTCL